MGGGLLFLGGMARLYKIKAGDQIDPRVKTQRLTNQRIFFGQGCATDVAILTGAENYVGCMWWGLFNS